MKTGIKLFLVLALMLISIQKTFAESISLDKAMEFGVLNNPTLKVARARLGISDAEILQASLRLNPSFLFQKMM